MRYLRSLLTILCFAFFGLGGFLIGTILFPFIIFFTQKERQPFLLTNTIHYSWILFVKILTLLRLIRVEIPTQKNCKTIKGTIIVANHPTLLDIVLLISIIPNTVCLVKKALSQNFFIKHIVNRIYLVNHEDPGKFLIKATTLLHQGLNVIIFPEGTRTDLTKGPSKLYKGFAHLALVSHAPILPIKITCHPCILGKNQKWYDIGPKTATYQIRFNKLIFAKDTKILSQRQQAQQISQEIYLKLFERIN